MDEQFKERPKHSISLDIPRRTPNQVERYGHHNLLEFALAATKLKNYLEPFLFKEAMECEVSIHWKEVMENEIKFLHKNNTWKLVRRPHDHKVVKCKWVCKLKAIAEDGGQPRYKARLFAKGFTQEERVDYYKIFSPIVKHTSIKILLSMVAHMDLKLE